eukprot:s9898_g1.t1
MEAAGPQWSWSSCSSVRSSSRAAARTPLKRSGPRAGEELRFATPKSCGGVGPRRYPGKRFHKIWGAVRFESRVLF